MMHISFDGFHRHSSDTCLFCDDLCFDVSDKGNKWRNKDIALVTTSPTQSALIYATLLTNDDTLLILSKLIFHDYYVNIPVINVFIDND